MVIIFLKVNVSTKIQLVPNYFTLPNFNISLRWMPKHILSYKMIKLENVIKFENVNRDYIYWFSLTKLIWLVVVILRKRRVVTSRKNTLIFHIRMHIAYRVLTSKSVNYCLHYVERKTNFTIDFCSIVMQKLKMT